MSWIDVKAYLADIDNVLLFDWKTQVDSTVGRNSFEVKMLEDWSEYFADLMDVNDDVTTGGISKSEFKQRLECEIAGTKEAIKKLKKFRDNHCVKKKHIQSLINLLELERKSNKRILNQL